MMSLNNASNEFITASIDHLLDFANDLDQLNLQLNKFYASLIHPDPSVQEFYDLSRCLLTPTSMLTGVEKYQPDITIADVQEYIFELCLETISKVITHDSSLMLLDKIKQLKPVIIPAQNYQLPFVSVASSQDISPEWNLIYSEGDAHSSRLRIDAELRNIYIEVRTFLWESHYERQFFCQCPPSDGSEDFEIRLLNFIVPYARTQAAEISKNFYLRLFFENKLLTTEEYINFYYQSHLIPLFSNQFYLECLANKKILFHQLQGLTASQVANLIHPTTIDLLKNQYCSFENATLLSKQQIAMARQYKDYFCAEMIPVTTLLSLSKEQCQMLLIPFIQNLIMQNILDLEIALQLPIHLKAIFSKSFYMEFLQKNRLNWRFFCKATEKNCEHLANKQVQTLIAERILKIEDVFSLPNEFFALLNRNTIFSLILNKQLSVQELLKCSLEILDLIETDKTLLFAIKNPQLKPLLFTSGDILKTYANIYAKRLCCIQESRPLNYYGQLDHIQTIKLDLKNSAFVANLPMQPLLELTLHNFTKQLQMRFQQLSKLMTNSRELFLYEEYANLFDTKRQYATNGAFLLNFILQATTRLNSLLQQGTRLYEIRSPFFFTKGYFEQLAKFNKGLEAIQSLILEVANPLVVEATHASNYQRLNFSG